MIGEKSQLMAVATAMVQHATERQSVIAENIANADTPGYRTRDIQSFAEIFKTGEDVRPQIDADAPISPNGNSVTLEAEVMRLAEARGQHEMGLGLWQQTLDMYRTALRGSR